LPIRVPKVYTECHSADYTLYDDGYFLNHTDLTDSGGNTEKFKQSWNASNVGTGWSDNESATFPYQGDQFFEGVGPNTSVVAPSTPVAKEKV